LSTVLDVNQIDCVNRSLLFMTACWSSARLALNITQPRRDDQAIKTPHSLRKPHPEAGRSWWCGTIRRQPSAWVERPLR
jgi:hypothetical protein